MEIAYIVSLQPSPLMSTIGVGRSNVAVSSAANEVNLRRPEYDGSRKTALI